MWHYVSKSAIPVFTNTRYPVAGWATAPSWASAGTRTRLTARTTRTARATTRWAEKYLEQQWKISGTLKNIWPSPSFLPHEMMRCSSSPARTQYFISLRCELLAAASTTHLGPLHPDIAAEWFFSIFFENLCPSTDGKLNDSCVWQIPPRCGVVR